MQLRAETVIDGKFKILSQLGAGGMGVVYKALQLELNRTVAIKFLQIGLTSSGEYIERFKREARAMAKLRHPHIVKFLDYGVWQSQIPYLVMEFVEGKSLRETLQQEERLSWKRAVMLIEQAAEALAYCHDQKTIHRDIKPENIFLVSAGAVESVKIADFGLSRLTSQGEVTLTEAGSVIGSPHYMSPEQGSGNRADERSDIYSLGCILFELITGAPPFEADSVVGLVFKRASEEAPSLESRIDCQSMPKELSPLLAAMLAREPGQRYQTMHKVQTSLNQLLLANEDRTDKIASINLPIKPRNHRANRILQVGLLLFSLSLAWCLTLGRTAVVERISADLRSQKNKAAAYEKATEYSRSLEKVGFLDESLMFAKAAYAISLTMPESRVDWSRAVGRCLRLFVERKDDAGAIRFLRQTLESRGYDGLVFEAQIDADSNSVADVLTDMIFTNKDVLSTFARPPRYQYTVLCHLAAAEHFVSREKTVALIRKAFALWKKTATDKFWNAALEGIALADSAENEKERQLAREIADAALGAVTYEEATSTAQLASSYRFRNQFEYADQYYKTCLETLRKHSSPPNPEVELVTFALT